MPANLRRAQDAYAELSGGAGTIRYALTVEEAVWDADLAIDFVPDELESKLEIFSLLDRMAPRADDSLYADGGFEYYGPGFVHVSGGAVCGIAGGRERS